MYSNANETDSISLLLGSNDAVTIYNSDFQLIAWNNEYADLGITPRKDVKYGLHLTDTYVLAARSGVFGTGDPNAIASKRIDEAFAQTSPRTELLSVPNGNKTLARRFFLPNIGVAAIFADTTELRSQFQRVRRKENIEIITRARRGYLDQLDSQLTSIMSIIDLARLTGDIRLLENFDSDAADIDGNGKRLTLHEAINQIVIGFESTFCPSKIRFSYTVDVDNCVVDVDQDMLFNCILNLLLNASDALNSEGGDVSLFVTRDPADDNKLQFVVSDNRKLSINSNDFGWELVNSFASKSNGSFAVTNRVDGSQSAKLVLTIAKNRTPNRNLNNRNIRQLEPPRVLLVEDQINVAHSAQILLASLRCETVTVASASEAKHLVDLTENHFDVILADFQSDSVDGGDLWKHCRQHCPDIPFIFCTSSPEDCIKFDDVNVLRKPLELDEFEALLARLNNDDSSID